MELYLFVWATLAWTVTIAALFPLNIPLAWGSYLIWNSRRPILEEMQDELWRRSAYFALVTALIAVGFVIVDHVLASWAGLPAGIIHLIVYLGLIAATAWMVMLFYAMEDFFSALNLLILYFYLPVFVLWLPDWLFFKNGNPLLQYAKSWLEKPT